MRVHRLSRVGMNLWRTCLRAHVARNDPSQLLLHGREGARAEGKGAGDRVALTHKNAALAAKKIAGVGLAVAGGVSLLEQNRFRAS